jgi:DNA-binding transcriptional regulator/RsmH inhibitor MraZ
LPADWQPLFITTVEPVLMLVPMEGTHLTMLPECRIKSDMRALKVLSKRSHSTDWAEQERINAALISVKAARRVTIGAGGRFHVPLELREQADLSGEVVLVGCYDHADIWSPTRWRDEEKRLLSEANRKKYHYF